MTDTTLLLTGVVVFGLMAIGVLMTILEFRQLRSVESKTAVADTETGRDRYRPPSADKD